MEACREYVKRHGHKLVAEELDLDQPGSRLQRPALDRALEAVEDGRADGIIVAALDRFTRSLAGGVELLQRLETANGALVCVREHFDTANPATGKLLRSILLAVSEWQLDAIKSNWETAKRHAIERGVHISGGVPVGYLRDHESKKLLPDPETALVIAQAFQLRASGSSWQEIASLLEEAQVPTSKGGTNWSSSALRQVIRNRVYLGEARQGEHVNPSAHEPIVPLAVWSAAQSTAVPSSGQKTKDNLLSGLVRCAGCRYVLSVGSIGGKYPYRQYRCLGKHAQGVCTDRASILANILDPFVEEAFLHRLRGDGEIKVQAMDEQADLRDAMAELERAEAEVALYLNANLLSIVGEDAYRAGLLPRQDAVIDARDRVAALQLHSGPVGDPVELLDVWDELTASEKRTILRESIDTVVVSKGRSRVVPERATILWRGEAPRDLPRRGHPSPVRPFFDNAPESTVTLT
jgi:DNA invertase Pin-like site-specific DNA recombinase